MCSTFLLEIGLGVGGGEDKVAIYISGQCGFTMGGLLVLVTYQVFSYLILSMSSINGILVGGLDSIFYVVMRYLYL